MASLAKSGATQKAREHALAFGVTIDGTPYSIAGLNIDPDVGHAAWRFHKLTAEDAVYDVHADGFGLQCQCQGYLRWGHCKHCETVMALSRMFSVRVEAPVIADIPRQPRPQLVPCSRCAGQGEAEDGCGCDWCAGRGFELEDRLIRGTPPLADTEEPPF